MPVLRRLTQEDLPRLRQFWTKHWGGEEIVTRGNVYRPEQLEGFVIEDDEEWIGLLTFVVKDEECEVISLDSLFMNQPRFDFGEKDASAQRELFWRIPDFTLVFDSFSLLRPVKFRH